MNDCDIVIKINVSEDVETQSFADFLSILIDELKEVKDVEVLIW